MLTNFEPNTSIKVGVKNLCKLYLNENLVNQKNLKSLKKLKFAFLV